MANIATVGYKVLRRCLKISLSVKIHPTRDLCIQRHISYEYLYASFVPQGVVHCVYCPVTVARLELVEPRSELLVRLGHSRVRLLLVACNCSGEL